MLKFDLAWLGTPPRYKMGTHATCIFTPKHYPAVKYCFATFQSQQTK